jgi:hypothetical protein
MQCSLALGCSYYLHVFYSEDGDSIFLRDAEHLFYYTASCSRRLQSANKHDALVPVSCTIIRYSTAPNAHPAVDCFYNATWCRFRISPLLNSASGCIVFALFLQRNVQIDEGYRFTRMREPGSRLVFLPRESLTIMTPSLPDRLNTRKGIRVLTIYSPQPQQESR